ncbi:hypothetical protein ES703_45684 [subsurface metagenome]
MCIVARTLTLFVCLDPVDNSGIYPLTKSSFGYTLVNTYVKAGSNHLTGSKVTGGIIPNSEAVY